MSSKTDVRQQFREGYHAARIFTEEFIAAGLPVRHLDRYRDRFLERVRGAWFTVLISDECYAAARGLAREYCVDLAAAREAALQHLDMALDGMAENLNRGPAQ